MTRRTKKPKKPPVVVVGPLRARPFRPPTKTDPRWYWRAFQGKEFVWAGRGTPKQVTEALMVVHGELQAQAAVQPGIGEEAVTVTDLLELYLGDCEERVESKQLSLNSLNHYDDCTKHMREAIGSVRVEMMAQPLERYIRGELKRFSSNFVFQQLCIIKAAFRWCRARGYTLAPEPPWPHFKRAPLRKKLTPSREEIRRLHDAMEVRDPMDPWEKELLLLWCSVGGRRAEICELRWEHFDSSQRQILLGAKTETAPRGGKTGPRWVPVRGQVLQMLRQRKLRLGGGPKDRIWVHATRPKRWARDELRDAASEAGLEGLTSHGLRRHFCTELIDAGATPKDYERLTGHSFQVGMRAYVESRSANRRSAIEEAGLGDLWEERGDERGDTGSH